MTTGSGMTTEQINLAHKEHGNWTIVCSHLLATNAVTEEDLKKPQSAMDSPGSVLCSVIRQWGESLADIRKYQARDEAQSLVPTIEHMKKEFLRIEIWLESESFKENTDTGPIYNTGAGVSRVLRKFAKEYEQNPRNIEHEPLMDGTERVGSVEMPYLIG